MALRHPGIAEDRGGWKDRGQPPAALPGITPHASTQDGDPRPPVVLVPVQPLAGQAARRRSRSCPPEPFSTKVKLCRMGVVTPC